MTAITTKLNTIQHLHVDPRDLLSTLTAVAEHGTLSAAGRALYLSPQGVKGRVIRLTEIIGEPLLTKTDNGNRRFTVWELTEVGRAVVDELGEGEGG